MRGLTVYHVVFLFEILEKPSESFLSEVVFPKLSFPKVFDFYVSAMVDSTLRHRYFIQITLYLDQDVLNPF